MDDYKEYVLGFMFNCYGDRLLLINKNRPLWQKGKINGIGGKLEANEHILEAMIREFKEETGIFSTDWEHCITLYSSKEKWVVYVFRGNLNEKTDVYNYKHMTDETVLLADVDDLPKNCIYNLKWIIPLLKDKVGFPLIIRDENNNQGEQK
jgi:8-oxo-dGTP diphosphatase